jgi:hypothetical protein
MVLFPETSIQTENQVFMLVVVLHVELSVGEPVVLDLDFSSILSLSGKLVDQVKENTRRTNISPQTP